jgi:hypothetical protein
VRQVLEDIRDRDFGDKRKHSTRLNRRREKLEKIGNWTNKQLCQGIAAVDIGMSMKRVA